MREFYAALEIENQIKDGDTPYPRPGYENALGMSLELRYSASHFIVSEGPIVFHAEMSPFPIQIQDRTVLP